MAPMSASMWLRGTGLGLRTCPIVTQPSQGTARVWEFHTPSMYDL